MKMIRARTGGFVGMACLLFACGWAGAQDLGAWGADTNGTRPGERPSARDIEVVTFAGGVLRGIGTRTPWGVRTIATLPESEGVLRPYQGLLYVLTPESGVVRVLDRDGNLVGSAFVDPASGPVDIAPIGDGAFYVSTATDGRVTRMDLGGGITRSFVDLHELDEPDEEPDPGMMIVDGGLLYVQLRRLDDKTPWMFAPRGALAVIDLASGSLVDMDEQTPGVQAMELTGPHPRLKMRIDDGSRRLFVSSSGADSYTWTITGAIDVVDLDSVEVLGAVIDESVGNFSAVWPMGPTTGYVMVHTDIVASSHLSVYGEPGSPFPRQIALELFGYVEAFACDARLGLVCMPTLDGRVRIIDTDSEQTLAIPKIGGGVATDIEIVRWR